MIYKFSHLHTQKGYTLLFAVLVSSIVLAIGISILNVSKKEFLLASSARESTSAFYAADSGLECAMYWNHTDRETNALATSTPGQITCGTGPAIDVVYDDPYPIAATSEAPAIAVFDVKFGDSASCGIVMVEKYYEYSDTHSRDVLETRITSRGYNLGWDDENGVNPNTCSIGSPRKVERALRFTF
ncbi:MAG: pilus assembly PilX N-terminal domain-containing protein [Patescibacteria group bacterium]